MKGVFYKTFLLFIVSISLVHAENSKSNFVIAIDVGHSKNRQGAVSARGVGEYIFNKKMAGILLEKLHNNGFPKAFIIGKDENLSLKERTSYASKNKADIFLSIHHDSVQKEYLSYWKYHGKRNHYSNKFKGYSIFISNRNKYKRKNIMLAKKIGTSLQNNNFNRTLHHAEKIKGESRKLLDRKKGIYQFNNLIVLKTAKMPAILLECGVIVNRDEEKLLSSNTYKEKLMSAVVEGINNYYSMVKI